MRWPKGWRREGPRLWRHDASGIYVLFNYGTHSKTCQVIVQNKYRTSSLASDRSLRSLALNWFTDRLEGRR